MPLIVRDGKLLRVGNALVNNEDCCCEEAECDGCPEGEARSRIQVDIPQLDDDGCGGDCSQIKGLFNLDLVLPSVGDVCRWAYRFDEPICGYDEISLTAQLSTELVDLNIHNDAGTKQIFWRKDYSGGTEPYTCTWDGEEIPVHGQLLTGNCKHDSPTNPPATLTTQ